MPTGREGAQVSVRAVAAPAAAPAGTGQPYGRVFNFSAGPACLPVEVLEEAQADLLNWRGSGMSVMEMSHRGKEFTSIIERAEADLRVLLGVPDSYKARGGAEREVYGLIYAGAQKNIGPAGVTVVIVREDLLGKARPITPVMLDYAVAAADGSMYNTPPCWAIYICGLVFAKMLRDGGLKAAQAFNEKVTIFFLY
eukprot:scaffold5.g991.t1